MTYDCEDSEDEAAPAPLPVVTRSTVYGSTRFTALTPDEFMMMDADDFETMMEEMELGDDDARFRVAVKAIADEDDLAIADEDDSAQPSPCARLLGMIQETPQPANGEDGAEVVASLKQEIAASQQENAELRRRVRELEEK